MTTEEARTLPRGARVRLHEFTGVVVSNDPVRERLAVRWDDGMDGAFWTHEGADRTDPEEDADGLRFLERERGDV